MDSRTFEQIMTERRQEARERYQQSRAWAAEVTVQLANQRSKFLEEFDENEKRILGLVPHP